VIVGTRDSCPAVVVFFISHRSLDAGWGMGVMRRGGGGGGGGFEWAKHDLHMIRCILGQMMQGWLYKVFHRHVDPERQSRTRPHRRYDSDTIILCTSISLPARIPSSASLSKILIRRN